MSNAGADIFLILLRPTRVPVTGEAVSHLFQGQVLIESLSWKLQNEEETKAAEDAEKKYSKQKNLVDTAGSLVLRSQHAVEDFGEALKGLPARLEGLDEEAKRKEINKLYTDHNQKMRELTGAERMKSFEELKQKRRDEEVAELDKNRNFEISFTKRVDIATTQMLNSMKAGDIFPSGTLTIHKRSATVADGTSLVFSLQKIRLLDYQLQVVVTDTMTEMMEQWTCEFASLAYVYKNPPSHYAHSNAAQAAAKIATQGTARTFTMKNIGSPI